MSEDLDPLADAKLIACPACGHVFDGRKFTVEWLCPKCEMDKTRWEKEEYEKAYKREMDDARYAQQAEDERWRMELEGSTEE